MNTFRCLLLAVCCLPLGACGSKALDVQVGRPIISRTRIVGRTLSSSLPVTISNPNLIGATVDSIRYEVTIRGDRFASGAQLAPLSIPGRGVVVRDTLPLVVAPSRTILPTAVRAMLGEPVTYELTGDAHLTVLGFIHRRVPLQGGGTLSIH